LVEKFPGLYLELSKKIDLGSRLVGIQLQSIDSSLLNAFISLIITSFLSKQYGLLLYWIPTSFLLMWIVLVFSLIMSQVRTRSMSEDMRKNKVKLSEKGLFLLLLRFKNTAPLFKTIAVIFFVSFVSLVIKDQLIKQKMDIPVVVPVVSCLLFFSLSIINTKVIGDIENNKKQFLSVKLGTKRWLFIMFYSVVFVGSLLVLPICSLYLLRGIYSWSTILSPLLVLILQIITTITFMNYFSSMSIKKEMTIALSRYSEIQQRIDYATMNNSMSNTDYSKIQESFEIAKMYNFTSDDSLLVNFYSLVPSPSYLLRLKTTPFLPFPKKVSKRQMYMFIRRKWREYLRNRKKTRLAKNTGVFPHFPHK
jgi:hypothetical protein